MFSWTLYTEEEAVSESLKCWNWTMYRRRRSIRVFKMLKLNNGQKKKKKCQNVEAGHYIYKKKCQSSKCWSWTRYRRRRLHVINGYTLLLNVLLMAYFSVIRTTSLYSTKQSNVIKFCKTKSYSKNRNIHLFKVVDRMSKYIVTIVFFPTVDVVDHFGVKLNESLGEVEVDLRSTEHTEVKDGLPYCATFVQIPALLSVFPFFWK